MIKAIGIDIGGTNTKLGVVTSEGKILHQILFSTQEFNFFESFLNRLTLEIQNLLDLTNLTIEDIAGIGIGIPNGNYKTGNIENPTNLKSWGTQEVVAPLKKKFEIPIRLDNDANVAALGEGFFGKAKELQDFIVVTIGTGVGTGIIANGKLIRGANGMASEGGHIKISDSDRMCGCGGNGHLESFVSISGIKKTVKELTNNDYPFREIVNLFHQQDPLIDQAISVISDQLALGLSAMGCLFAPKAIILTGGITIIGDEFVKKVQQKYEELIYAPFKNVTTISLSEISKENGAILGAASLIFHN